MRKSKIVTFDAIPYSIRQFGYIKSITQMEKIVTPIFPAIQGIAATQLSDDPLVNDVTVMTIVQSLLRTDLKTIAEHIPEFFSEITRASDGSSIDWEEELSDNFGLLTFLLAEVIMFNYNSLFTIQEAVMKSSLSERLTNLLTTSD